VQFNAATTTWNGLVAEVKLAHRLLRRQLSTTEVEPRPPGGSTISDRCVERLLMMSREGVVHFGAVQCCDHHVEWTGGGSKTSSDRLLRRQLSTTEVEPRPPGGSIISDRCVERLLMMSREGVVHFGAVQCCDHHVEWTGGGSNTSSDRLLRRPLSTTEVEP